MAVITGKYVFENVIIRARHARALNRHFNQIMLGYGFGKGKGGLCMWLLITLVMVFCAIVYLP